MMITLCEIVDAMERSGLRQYEKLPFWMEQAFFQVIAVHGITTVARFMKENSVDEFDVILAAVGDKKIQVIKEVRGLTTLGLKDAKELVDGAPKPVLEGVDKETAEKAKETLEGVGATIELK